MPTEEGVVESDPPRFTPSNTLKGARDEGALNSGGLMSKESGKKSGEEGRGVVGF